MRTRHQAFLESRRRKRDARCDHKPCAGNGCADCEHTGIDPSSEAWKFYKADDADRIAAYLAKMRLEVERC